MRLLEAIYEKTGGRNRGVQDVTELETGLAAEVAREAWHELLRLHLIERFSLDYAARLSPSGVEFIEGGQRLPYSPEISEVPRRKVLVIAGSTAAGNGISTFIDEMACNAILLDQESASGKSLMERVESHGDAAYAVVLLSQDDLGGPAGELRPRMNVLLELGYLIGRLGRGKVHAIAIDRTEDLPGDLAGVTLQPMDDAGNWKASLSRELLES